MELHKNDLATNSKLPGQLADNFNQIELEDAQDDNKVDAIDKKHTENEQSIDQNHTDNETKLDQKYSQITNQLKASCADLKEGEEKLDSDKASKIMLYKWWKELDDKFSACVDDLDDKKASKKKVRQEIANLQQEFNKNLNDLRQLVQTDHDDLQDKINHLYAGDPETIKKVVVEVLKEGGVLNA